MDQLAHQKFNNFNDEFKKQFLIESKLKLSNLMADLDMSKDDFYTAKKLDDNEIKDRFTRGN